VEESFVIAIAGGSASGKSTLAEALCAHLRTFTSCDHVAMDRHMRRTDELAPHFLFSFTGERTFNANDPESVDNLAVLAVVEASDAQVVIVDGLMALASEEIRSRAALKVFVDLDADIRAVRRVERDIRTGRSGGDPALIAAYYLECARIGHEKYVQPSKAFADLIVRGDASLDRTVELLSRLVPR